jgi:hypothetical protein
VSGLNLATVTPLKIPSNSYLVHLSTIQRHIVLILKAKLNNPAPNKRKTEVCDKFKVLPLYCWYTLDGRAAGSSTGQDMVADRKQSSSLIIQPTDSHSTD